MLEKIVSKSRASLALLVAAAGLGYSVDSEAKPKRSKSSQEIVVEQVVIKSEGYRAIDPQFATHKCDVFVADQNPIYGIYHHALEYENGFFQTDSLRALVKNNQLLLETASGKVVVDMNETPRSGDKGLYDRLDGDESQVVREAYRAFRNECSRARSYEGSFDRVTVSLNNAIDISCVQQGDVHGVRMTKSKTRLHVVYSNAAKNSDLPLYVLTEWDVSGINEPFSSKERYVIETVPLSDFLELWPKKVPNGVSLDYAAIVGKYCLEWN